MTKRRTKGEGSITKLTNGRYKVRIEIEPVDGKRKWLSSTVDTKTEAIAKLKTLQRQKEDTKTKESSYTILNCLDAYLSYKKSQEIKATTINLNRRIISKALAPFFVDIPVSSITLQDISSLVNSWSHLKTSTKRSYIGICKDFFNWLVFTHQIGESPFEHYKTPKRKTKTYLESDKFEVLSSEEHKLLKDVMQQHFETYKNRPLTSLRYRFYPLYLLAYETGMRAGEIAGLKWSAIDFDNCVVSVTNNVTDCYDGKGYKDSTPKTYSGFRRIIVSSATLGVLKTLNELYMLRGIVSDYVFPALNQTREEIVPPRKYTEVLKYFMEILGMKKPHFTFHSIRHTNASIMIANGVDIGVVTERLGHANIGITLKTYAHALKDSKDKNIAVVVA